MTETDSGITRGYRDEIVITRSYRREREVIGDIAESYNETGKGV